MHAYCHFSSPQTSTAKLHIINSIKYFGQTHLPWLLGREASDLKYITKINEQQFSMSMNSQSHPPNDLYKEQQNDQYPRSNH